MAYASQSDIENEMNGGAFDAGSGVTSGGLAEMLDQESAVIDQYLSTQYVTPVTDSTAIKVLKKICTDFVVFRVAKALRQSEGLTDNSEPRDVSESAAYRESLRLLKMFSSGQLALSGAAKQESKKKIMGFTPDKSTTENVFKKDEKQW